jgi:hypothetical protein
LKRPRKLLLTTKATRKDIIGAKNGDVLISENLISYFRINGSGNDFMNNLDMILDYQSLIINDFLKNYGNKI